MTEKPADGVKGFLLYSPFERKYFFRVYGEDDPVTGDKPFTDYRLCADDIEVTINDRFVALYEDEEDAVNGSLKNRLDYTSRALGRDKRNPPDSTLLEHGQ